MRKTKQNTFLIFPFYSSNKIAIYMLGLCNELVFALKLVFKAKILSVRESYNMKCIKVSVVRSEGVEPATPRSEVWCSIQLSYERVKQMG